MSKKKRFILTRRNYNTLIGRGYNLVCKLCKHPLQIGDCIESKPSKYGKQKRKYYHCECYDGSFIDVGDDEEDNDEFEFE